MSLLDSDIKKTRSPIFFFFFCSFSFYALPEYITAIVCKWRKMEVTGNQLSFDGNTQCSFCTLVCVCVSCGCMGVYLCMHMSLRRLLAAATSLGAQEKRGRHACTCSLFPQIGKPLQVYSWHSCTRTHTDMPHLVATAVTSVEICEHIYVQ